MKFEDIATIAKKRGLKTSKMNKHKLIKAIQLDEGNFDCFGTAWDGECDQKLCDWRADCFKSSST